MVFGAHLSGEPLNPQLQALGARFVRACRSSADYRLYALKGGVARPGLVRVDSGGAALEGEIWALSPAALGVFVADIPRPPATADVPLAGGLLGKGFFCAAVATPGAAAAHEHR